MTTLAPAPESAALDRIRGRIIDLDSHYMLFPWDLAEIFGFPMTDEARAAVAKAAAVPEAERTFFTDPALSSDEALASTRARARDDVWNVKGWGAHGAQVVPDRVDALDQMGVARQLVFPTGMWAAMHGDKPHSYASITRYNDHVLDWADGQDRVRPACLINTHEVERALTELRRVLDRGARLVQFACAEPWAGISPAASEWEPLWSALEDAGAAGLFHLGSHGGGGPRVKAHFVSPRWAKGASGMQFAPKPDGDPGEVFGPFHMTTIHMAPETALSAMIFGGVFERHPALRFGVIEMGANWVAPFCERLDMTADTFARQLSGQLTLRPSEYMRRQVRVTPYYHEPVATWLERSRELEDVYVFSTDFPHPEGGRDPIDKFLNALAPLGEDVVEKFFVTNGSLLLS